MESMSFFTMFTDIQKARVLGIFQWSCQNLANGALNREDFRRIDPLQTKTHVYLLYKSPDRFGSILHRDFYRRFEIIGCIHIIYYIQNFLAITPRFYLAIYFTYKNRSIFSMAERMHHRGTHALSTFNGISATYALSNGTKTPLTYNGSPSSPSYCTIYVSRTP